MRRARLLAAASLSLALATLLTPAPARAQLRIVDYNIAQNSRFNSPDENLNTSAQLKLILDGIGDEIRNGFFRPIDVMSNQELTLNGTETAYIVARLNELYPTTTYAAAPLAAGAITGGNGLPSLIYNTSTVSVIGPSLAFGNVGDDPDQQPRSTLRYHLRPVGYGASADFYIYNSHYKAGDEVGDVARREIEATSIRADSDGLGQGIHALYVGDYNIPSAAEDMYQTLLAPGPGKAVDPLPLDHGSTWNNNSAYKAIHTQSPATVSAFTSQTLEGVDDRFDFQLATEELNDAEGLSIIPGSYHTFGNNGNHFMNQAINIVQAGMPLAAPQDVLNALTVVSDHIPVVLDLQLPAVMGVQVASAPPSVAQGATVNINVMVQNLVNALVQAGGDELDYTVSVSGDLTGGAAGTVQSLAAANNHSISLNTATAGQKNGTITVTALSQGAANPLFTQNVQFTVGEGGGGPPPLPPNYSMRMPVASDNLDVHVNLNSFAQTPLPGAYNPSTVRGFQRYKVGETSPIPTPTLDQTTSGVPADQIGIFNPVTKLDAWFGVSDTRESPVNPIGDATATWDFNVSGATALEVSIDMGACGNFESGTDVFDWTYSLDGGSFQPLFTSSVNGGSQSYTFASTAVVTYGDPLIMTNTAGQATTLVNAQNPSNALQTLTSAISGAGNVLTLRFHANANGDSGVDAEAYAFDNIVVTGLVSFLASDFNKDRAVNSADLTLWRNGFGTGSTKAQGDADNDGDVDGADFLIWQRQVGQAPPSVPAGSPVPEPATATVLLVTSFAFASSRRRR